MKVGLLSDIHGNATALESVLSSAREKKVEKLLCCGDYVGYYYQAAKTLALLNEWEWEGVSGNHEAMLSDWLENRNRKKIKDKYGSGIAIAAKELGEINAKFLFNKPSMTKILVDDKEVILCHGSPWNRDFYVYPDANKVIIEKMEKYDPSYDILVFGHTHYPILWEVGHKKIINPGSVGQPRDRKPGACWALWDTATNEVEFFREDYNCKPVIEMCEELDPENKYLKDVLVRK